MALVKYAVLGVSLILGVSYLFNRGGNQKAPQLGDAWWGPGSEKPVDEAVRPFKIKFSNEDINDLKARLKNTRNLKPALEGTGWTYGVNGGFVPTIIDHWMNKYNFTERQEYLNKYPQFVTNIQGLDIHFLHVKPNNAGGKKVLPLLIQHGWPGSVIEMYKIIPMLTTPRDEFDFVFEVIVPSLPGYGFSSGTTKPGLGSAQMAVILKNLMLRLGFKKFYTQGGDWGAIITANLASMFPQHVLGMHSNMCIVMQPQTFLTTYIYSFWPSMLIPEEDYHLMYPLSEKWSRRLEESGYLHIQATKPDTLGVALTDSPAGLAAYILEKFSTGTNPELRFKDNGGLLDKYSADELLDNVMLYWIPNSMTTAMRLYAEHFSAAHMALGMEYVPIDVPSACAQFPHEISYQPPSLLSARFKKLIRARKMPRGGHFAAFEEPQLLADEIWTSIGIMEAGRKQSQASKASKASKKSA
ncbi:juvenile hormone epoxide hydrolase 1-like [Neodiprion virginianus]|uniref:Epoxide hydrolase n=1 Tax=Neodiprion lecontei TaxID=441921 RepID=A0A6J0CBC4_NEOLC|nr:juvenile hormone epoxide hydrolase 1 isoform X1 [Neodiprion lecontei]XP_046609575.1 juvenile hormone epoxide hydrolase 1-like [Neodiprion virginianus]